MAKRAVKQPKKDTPRDKPFLHRWYGRLCLLLLSVVLLTLSVAPVKQFYLAWVALVPWLWVVAEVKTARRAFFWSWLAGTLYFLANMWWLAYVSTPGMFGLMLYFGLYWSVAALLVRAWSPAPGSTAAYHLRAVLGFAAIWTALDYLRGTLFTGLPWVYLGHSQSPILIACQIADIFGVYGITFCVAALNALVFLYVRDHRPALRPATGVVVAMWGISCTYGLWRLLEMEKTCSPGPTVLVVQPNYPQTNKGDKGASEADRLQFHLKATIDAIKAHTGPIDLVCWSETVMPGLNEEYRRAMHGARIVDRTDTVVDPDYGTTLDKTVDELANLAGRQHINLLTGGLYEAGLIDAVHFYFADRRNSVYFFRADGTLDPLRYDKIHLVPFGEFIPFKHSRWFHWIHDFFNSFNPYGIDYTLTAGPDDSPAVFTITPATSGKPVRIVAPICLEDINAAFVAQLFRGEHGKRADMIVNLTNDGWFDISENPQHLQAALFRCIENRAPMARCVNTGISVIADSYGRVSKQLPQGIEGVAVDTMVLDSRYTLYTRWGDWFAWTCLAVTGALALGGTRAWFKRRRTPAP